MRAGIIAEGRSDLAVIANILKGKLGIERSDIQFLVPELELDETDLATQNPDQFSNWTIVKRKCQEGLVIQSFLNSVEDTRFLIIHIDAAERMEPGYEVIDLPDSGVAETRTRIIEKIKEWLGNHFNERISFAVAVEETDAWLIPLFDIRQRETGELPRPKERLEWLIQRSNQWSDREKQQILREKTFKKYDQISKPLRKTKILAEISQKNESLQAFCTQLMQFEA